MSEARKRCPKGENYNKETKRCEPKTEVSQRASTRKARVSSSTDDLAPRASARVSPTASPRASARVSPKSSPKSLPKSSPKSLPKSSPKSLPNASTVDSFIMHETADLYRLLVSVPINNPELWPNPNICYFRTSGRSNKGYEIFRGSWFPIAGIKDSSKMPKFLPERNDGFLIKMSFILNQNADLAALKQPSWITNLIGDYPIILDESEKGLFDNKSIITINEFMVKNKYIQNKKNKILDTRYERLALHIKLIISESFGSFMNYFLYEWQAMLSLRIGGGYWDSNPFFTEYISRKLANFDLVPVPHIDETLKRASEAELGKIYESDPNNNKETNRGKPTINFAERTGTQLSLKQIIAIKTVEEAKFKSENQSSILSFLSIRTVLEDKYTDRIDQYIRVVQQTRNISTNVFSKLKK